MLDGVIPHSEYGLLGGHSRRYNNINSAEASLISTQLNIYGLNQTGHNSQQFISDDLASLSSQLATPLPYSSSPSLQPALQDLRRSQNAQLRSQNGLNIEQQEGSRTFCPHMANTDCASNANQCCACVGNKSHSDRHGGDMGGARAVVIAMQRQRYCLPCKGKRHGQFPSLCAGADLNRILEV